MLLGEGGGERDADDDDQNDVDGRAAAADPTGNTPPEREEMDSEPIHSQRAVEGRRRRRKGSGIEELALPEVYWDCGLNIE